MQSDVWFPEFQKLGREQTAAYDAFQEVLKARGQQDASMPVISTQDQEAMATAHRLRDANLAMGAWLDANVKL